MSSARNGPCPSSPPLAWVRTNIRGEPNQLNFLLPPCKMVERGSEVSMIIKFILMDCPLSHVPMWGKEDKGGPIQASFPYTPPESAEIRKEQVKMSGV
jgi:hypothetical protein